jgi:hypothetical protein
MRPAGLRRPKESPHSRSRHARTQQGHDSRRNRDRMPETMEYLCCPQAGHASGNGRAVCDSRATACCAHRRAMLRLKPCSATTPATTAATATAEAASRVARLVRNSLMRIMFFMVLLSEWLTSRASRKWEQRGSFARYSAARRCVNCSPSEPSQRVPDRSVLRRAAGDAGGWREERPAFSAALSSRGSV